MAQVRWTPQAADDLDAIAEFIARDSSHFAGLFVADILQTVDRLADFPESGRMVPIGGHYGYRGQWIEDHFVDITKMIEIGKGGQRSVKTIQELGGTMPENLPPAENIKKLEAKKRKQPKALE
jgi:plasmid stabilization system protein ParE